MINEGPRNVLGVRVHAVDYEYAVDRIIGAAAAPEPLGVSALAVHGVMTGVDDDEHRGRLNRLDLVTPDGQPVRWAIRWLHGVRLPDRVYGPNLMRHVVARAAEKGLSIYLFGSTEEVLAALRARLTDHHPDLIIAGSEASQFRTLTEDEQAELARRIGDSGAGVAFVGLGCPRQEVFVSEMVEQVGLPMLAVGAAFEYLAELKDEPPEWIQRFGLQWLYRLVQNPVRLGHRYLVLSPRFVARFLWQRLGLWKPDLDDVKQPATPQRWG